MKSGQKLRAMVARRIAASFLASAAFSPSHSAATALVRHLDQSASATPSTFAEAL